MTTLLVFFQNCDKRDSPDEKNSKVNALESIGPQSFALEGVYDKDDNKIEKKMYRYSFNLPLAAYDTNYKYAISSGPSKDCNSSGTFCTAEENGFVECISMSTLMGCPCEYDVADFYFIPAKFRLEILDKNAGRIKIIDHQSGEYAILSNKLDGVKFDKPEEVCSDDF